MVLMGSACTQTEHGSNCKSGDFHQSFKLKRERKKKRERGEKKKRKKKENTIQALPWPNLALLRKGNFPEPPSTNLEAQSCSQECQCKSRTALPATGGVMAAVSASSPAGKLLLSPCSLPSAELALQQPGSQLQVEMQSASEWSEFVLFAEPRSGSPNPVLLRAACDKTAASLGWMAATEGPHVLLRACPKCFLQFRLPLPKGLPTAEPSGAMPAASVGFFGSSPLPTSPREAKEIGGKPASAPAPVYVQNLQGKSYSDE